MHHLIKDTNRVFIGDQIPEKYLIDNNVKNVNRPKAVFLPLNEDEVVEIVKYAHTNDIKMICRGAGTGAVGSQVPVLGDEFIIDLSLMNQIKSLDEETLTLTVGPGVLLEEVQKYVENKGYFYPPDPGSKMSTIGGNVSTNAGGMRALKYGTTRNYVRSMNVVLSDGTKVKLGGLTIKDSSGYDLKDLFIGSEGTLGIITEIQLKIIPKPKHQKSMILAFNNVVEATDTVLSILKNGFMPTALELLEKEAVLYSESFLKQKFPSQVGNAYILATIDGNDLKEIESTILGIKQLVEKQVIEFIILDEADEKLAWMIRDNILYALYALTQFEMLDEVVPINQFGKMIRYTKELQEKHKIEVLNFGHAGDGNIHTIILKKDYSDETWKVKRVEFLDDLYDKVKELGGLVSAEHGIGYTKKSYFLKITDSNKIEIMRAIKNALDPKNLLNPTKVF